MGYPRSNGLNDVTRRFRTIVSFLCSAYISCLSSTIFNLCAFFQSSIMLAYQLRPLEEHTRPEVTSPTDSATTISNKYSVRNSRLARMTGKLKSIFQSAIKAERFRLLEGVRDRKRCQNLMEQAWFSCSTDICILRSPISTLYALFLLSVKALTSILHGSAIKMFRVSLVEMLVDFFIWLDFPYKNSDLWVSEGKGLP